MKKLYVIELNLWIWMNFLKKFSELRISKTMKICIHRVFKAYASISIRLVLIELQQAVQKFDYQD